MTTLAKPGRIYPILFTTAVLIIATAFFTAFSPGIWAHDSRATLAAAASGAFFKTQPPFVQYALQMFLFFRANLSIVFLIQVYVYWFAVLVMGIHFLRVGKPLIALPAILVALLPPNLFLL
jgi:hypothetical protein